MGDSSAFVDVFLMRILELSIEIIKQHFINIFSTQMGKQMFQEVKFCFQVYLTGSVQFSRSVVSDSLRPHELQHARPPCPSPSPGVHSNSRPSSQ